MADMQEMQNDEQMMDQVDKTMDDIQKTEDMIMDSTVSDDIKDEVVEADGLMTDVQDKLRKMQEEEIGT
jgi:hypothetical protein